jgi:hypothetical protein
VKAGDWGMNDFPVREARSVAQLASYRPPDVVLHAARKACPIIAVAAAKGGLAWRRSADSATMSALVFPPNLEAGAAPTEPGSLPGAAPYTGRGTIAGALWRRRGFASTSRRSSQGDRRGHWPLLRL